MPRQSRASDAGIGTMTTQRTGAEASMTTRYEPVPFSDIRDEVRSHLATFPSAIDSFLEEHILASTHYRVIVDGENAGFASIHGESLITQFALSDTYKAHGQHAFAQLRRMEQVQSAFVPTADEFFLTHALDDYRQLAKQACFFRALPVPQTRDAREQGVLRLAEPGDAEAIRQGSGTFFGDVERSIEHRALFLTERRDEIVGFGLIEKSTLYDDVASVGMYTIGQHRQQGVGTVTIRLLVDECGRRGLRPIAGCWYYNHGSKRTLERAGMFSQSRLLKIDY
jgi:RimJ/RimL family protein N-acetyltransferase